MSRVAPGLLRRKNFKESELFERACFSGHFCARLVAAVSTGTHANRSRRAKETGLMAYWLMKSEPGSYSWDDLVRDGGTEWDGVRNAAARLHLRAMREGDEAFFYHSGADKAALGIMRIARGAA